MNYFVIMIEIIVSINIDLFTTLKPALKLSYVALHLLMFCLHVRFPAFSVQY